MSKRLLRIGLTGGISSGKSTVAQMLVSLGAHLVDTDAIARALTLPGGRAIDPLRQRFGERAIDGQGALDRAWMREHAFRDPAVRRELEAILHPLIGEQTRSEAALARGDAVVFDVPLLAESGRWRTRVDRILVVDCSEQRQVQRVMQRSGWSREEVERVIAQQSERRVRRSVADAVIDNEADGLDALRASVGLVFAHWCAAARERSAPAQPPLA